MTSPPWTRINAFAPLDQDRHLRPPRSWTGDFAPSDQDRHPTKFVIIVYFWTPMAPKRRKCVFNDELKSKYTFIKASTNNDNSEVECVKCRSVFSIANSGKTDIENHIQTVKHKRAMSAAIASMSVTSYFKKKQFEDAERKLAAAEGLWAYHTVMNNHSFRSMDCTCKLIKTCFDARFTCSRTKCEAIVTDVLVPYAKQLLEEDLDAANFISIYSDASNHKEVVMNS
ncbi:hypothetical protein KIL84_001879 [Mauremys mutica]|uniref:Uncharacterized protein n=1 Tax=Mauremys mutica TaxID=74926 RepID=A0A9D4B5F1_9SAUR|nr:hypothetical protein KIL84_001879 [Mauremys mutica]